MIKDQKGCGKVYRSIYGYRQCGDKTYLCPKCKGEKITTDYDRNNVKYLNWEAYHKDQNHSPQERRNSELGSVQTSGEGSNPSEDTPSEDLDNRKNSGSIPDSSGGFCLSEKRKELWKRYGHGEITSHVYQIILLQDKEFIKLLKFKFRKLSQRTPGGLDEFFIEINKIAGDELVK